MVGAFRLPLLRLMLLPLRLQLLLRLNRLLLLLLYWLHRLRPCRLHVCRRSLMLRLLCLCICDRRSKHAMLLLCLRSSNERGESAVACNQPWGGLLRLWLLPQPDLLQGPLAQLTQACHLQEGSRGDERFVHLHTKRPNKRRSLRRRVQAMQQQQLIPQAALSAAPTCSRQQPARPLRSCCMSARAWEPTPSSSASPSAGAQVERLFLEHTPKNMP